MILRGEKRFEHRSSPTRIDADARYPGIRPATLEETVAVAFFSLEGAAALDAAERPTEVLASVAPGAAPARARPGTARGE